MHKLKEAAQRMVDAFAPHADKCRPCTIEWQNLKEALAKQEWVGLNGADWNDFNPLKSNDPHRVAEWVEKLLKERNT